MLADMGHYIVLFQGTDIRNEEEEGEGEGGEERGEEEGEGERE